MTGAAGEAESGATFGRGVSSNERSAGVDDSGATGIGGTGGSGGGVTGAVAVVGAGGVGSSGDG